MLELYAYKRSTGQPAQGLQSLLRGLAGVIVLVSLVFAAMTAAQFMPSFDGVLSFLSVFLAGCFKALLLWCAAAVIDALRNVAVHTAITADAALIENHAREQRVLPHGETGPSVQQDQGFHEPAAHR